MSAGQSTAFFENDPRYLVIESRALRMFLVSDTRGSYRGAPYKLADAYKTRIVANYYASLLNRGCAVVNPHAVVGCRIEAKS